MPSSVHLISPTGSYNRKSYPIYRGEKFVEFRTRPEEYAWALCGEELVRGRDTFFNVLVVEPESNFDWCQDCVRAVAWSEDFRIRWQTRGIRFGPTGA